MRSSRKLSALLFTAAALSVLVVRDVGASAPADQYEPFMPGDTYILDKWTDLYWQRQVDAEVQLDQPAAITACASKSPAGTWRLPTYNELLTLLDDEPHDAYEGGTIVRKAIDRDAFPGTPTKKRFWSSSVAPGGGGFSVHFGIGVADAQDTTIENYVRCVADSHP